MPARVTVRCTACGWGPERRRPSTIARGCPDCTKPLEVHAKPTTAPTIRATLRLVEGDLEELAPREQWSRVVRDLVAAAAQAKREARARGAVASAR